VKRSHRVDDQEFYQLLDKNGITDDIHLFNEEDAGVGERLELPPAARGLGRTDSVRTADRENETGNVTGVLGTYNAKLAAPSATMPNSVPCP
jgi:hypothetical protein